MTALGRGIALMIGILALGLAGAAMAQENLNAGKTPAQLYASDCAICHKTTRGMNRAGGFFGLENYLRKHYTSSRESAAAIAAYVRKVEGGRLRAQAQRHHRSSKAAKTRSTKTRATKPGAMKAGATKPAQKKKAAEAKPAAKKQAEKKPADTKTGEAKPAGHTADQKAKTAAAKMDKPKMDKPKGTDAEAKALKPKTGAKPSMKQAKPD